jgi:hypothetical protein
VQLAGTIIAGAGARLLPPSIPYRFFFASGVYHLLGWALMLTAAVQVPVFQGGPGFTLAALHALTLGVFVMTAMGASLQIVPVVTGQSLKTLWPARLASWLFIPSVGVLVVGFASSHSEAIAAGGISLTVGLILYVSVIVRLLAQASSFKVLRYHFWLALAALAALVLIGLAMIFDLLSIDQDSAAMAHGTIALFGFMGLLAMGFASVLVPMFALANAPSQGYSLFVMALFSTGLIACVSAALAGQYQIVVIGAGMMLMAALAHVLSMYRVIKTGMKKKLGISFILIRISWIVFPLSIAGGIAAVSGVPFEPALLLAGYLAIFGWLLTFVLGVQQQIMPFLAAMNASTAGNKPPRLSQLARGAPLKIHAVCHFIAFVFVGIGIATDMETAVQAGAACGLVGASAFLWFTTDVYRRMNSKSPKNERTQI